MRTRSRGPLAGFGWLSNGIALSFRRPGPLFGGAAWLLLVCLLPSLLTVPIQLRSLHAGLPPDPMLIGGLTLGSALLGLLILPLYAGYLQVFDATERGLPARARDIFKPYGQGQAVRLIGFGLAVLLVYVLVFAVVIAASGNGLAHWYLQMFAAQANHQPPPTGLPHGFGTALALFLLLWLFMMGFYAISLGQVALRDRGVFGALGDGVVGAFKNVLPLLMLALGSLLALVVIGLGFLLVGALLALLGKFGSGWLALVLLVPLYVAFMLWVFAAMFGVMYSLWRDVCGDDASDALPAAA